MALKMKDDNSSDKNRFADFDPAIDDMGYAGQYNAVRSTATTVKKEDTSVSKAKESSFNSSRLLILVTEILLYIAYGVLYYMIFKTVRDGLSNPMELLTSLIPVIAVVMVVLILDMACVFKTNGFDAKLLLIGIILPPFYLMYRDKLIHEKSGFGSVVAILFIAAAMYIGISAYSGGSRYGNLNAIKDTKTRKAAIELMKSEARNGNEYRFYFIGRKSFTPDNAKVYEKGGMKFIDLYGVNHIVFKPNEDGAYESRISDSRAMYSFLIEGKGQYKLIGITLGGKRMTNADMELHWELLTGEQMP